MLGGHGKASFTSVSSGSLPPQTVQHTPELLATLASLSAPGAEITLVQAVSDTKNDKLVTADDLVSAMKLAGMVEVQEPEAFDSEHANEVRDKLDLGERQFRLVAVRAKMPAYQQGSSRLLSFAKKTAETKSEDRANVG